MPKQLFQCEKCKNEFVELSDCMQHEVVCMNEQDTAAVNFEKALAALQEKYQLAVSEKALSLSVSEVDGFAFKQVFLDLRAELPNGHEIFLNGNWHGDTTENALYNAIEKHCILPFLQTAYEGVLRYRHDGYWLDLGGEGIDLHELCHRLQSKKIRIERIN